MAHKSGEWHSESKRVEVVTTYLILGKSSLVEAATGVPQGTIRRWKMEPWWADLVAQIQTEDTQELDAKLSNRVNKALDIVSDRLDNGDFMFNPRTGEFTRRPVSLKDTWKATKEMVDLRTNLRKAKPIEADQEAVGDILKSLAKEFGEMAKKKVKETLDGPQLQVGVPELPRETRPDSETVPAEQSSTAS